SDAACWVQGVNFSPALKWFIVLLLPLTLCWKLTVRPDDSTKLGYNIVKFLTDQHFDVTVTDEEMNGMPIVRADADGCRMLIARISAQGWERDMIPGRATSNDSVFVVFRGRVYANQPTWLTVVSHLWSRFLYELGLVPHVTPVIAVVASTSCNANRLPWNQLRESSAP